jgi:hypothetical protein
MKTLFRAFGLTATLALVGLAAASSQALDTCRYLCRNISSGKTIHWAAEGTTQNNCCSGNVPCPAGYTWDGFISWNGGGCP